MDENKKKCSQQDCEEPALYWYLWPGAGEVYACEKHALLARRIGEAMGMTLDIYLIQSDLPTEDT